MNHLTSESELSASPPAGGTPLSSAAKAARVALASGLALVLVVACRHEDAPPTQTVYQNGYPQTQQQAYGSQVTYQNGYPQQGYYGQQQAAPQAAPPAAATVAPAPTSAPAATAPPATVAPAPAAPATGTMIGAVAAPPPPAMAVPGVGALPCQNDAACILGRCNVQYGRCAYPCKNTAVDCAANAVCGPLGLCVPNVQIQQQTPR